MKTGAKFGCAILGAAIAVAIASPAHAAEELVDVTKNPGCGVKLKTKEEKIARNKRLAEYYFAGWNAEVMNKYGHQFRFNDYDCFLPSTTYRMGFGLSPEPPEFVKLPVPTRTGPYKPQHPPTPFHAVLPDWGTIPGTLRVYPAENSAYFIMRFGGTTPKGQHVEFWETDFFVINDDGYVTHWEGYNDVMGVDQLFRLVFGRGVKEMGSIEDMMGGGSKAAPPSPAEKK